MGRWSGRRRGTEGNDAFLDGIVDDVVIYNRPLSKTEIMELMVTDLSTAVEPAGKLATRWAELKVR
ncbi:MAG: hypothetical protein KatS3mg115_1535 [Candidatus Poribacteria bacterium]|nr:MAG: hypothetical protein KatS3mg115_1535 [Candidatus Poribacteria bacterium]